MSLMEPVRRHATRDAVLGAAAILAGSVLLSALAFVAYGQTAFCRSMAVTLGLTLPLLLSALGQGLVVGGLVAVWTALRRRP